jgi:hypothetical protein
MSPTQCIADIPGYVVQEAIHDPAGILLVVAICDVIMLTLALHVQRWCVEQPLVAGVKMQPRP